MDILNVACTDLGFVGNGMPTTDEEAKAFAENVADPARHFNTGNSEHVSYIFQTILNFEL